jgi:polygalacturonase
MRADAAPPIDQSITPDWTGLHAFAAGINLGNDIQYNGRVECTDVRVWGAKGDGTTDDTTAFQNAINFMANTFHGGKVKIPPGTYVLRGGIVVPNFII